MKTISVVVNARLESSRCPKKHIRNLSGTTLIDECLKKVNELTNVEEIYLAAGDNELIDKLNNYENISLLEREKESVVKGQIPFHIAFAHYKKVSSEYIMIINPCQPFVDKKVYQDEIDYFKQSEYDGALSVKENKNFYFFQNGEIANFDGNSRLCSISGPSMLECTHTFMFFKKSFFINNGKMWPNEYDNPHPIKIPNEGLMDVDTEEDFEIVFSLIRRRNQYESVH